MRSKIAAVLTGGAIVLAGALPAAASTTEHQISGRVSHLDASAKTLAVKKDDAGVTARETDFTLAPDAKIMQGPNARSLSELKPGERVRVTYVDQGSAHQAKRIDVLPPRTAKAMPTKSPGKEPAASR